MIEPKLQSKLQFVHISLLYVIFKFLHFFARVQCYKTNLALLNIELHVLK